MDYKKLVDFCKMNPYAAKLILALAEEYRPDKVLSAWSALSILETLEISVSYSQIIALFRQLESLECGTFFIGRKGKKSRFYWTVDIKIIGKALEDSVSEIVPSPKLSAPAIPASTHSTVILRHTFHLRHDFELVLNLPADLTEKDAQRISKFVESLPQ